MSDTREMEKPTDASVLPTHLSRKRGERKLAAGLLYLASIIGLLYLFVSPIILHRRTPLFGIDVAAYLVLAALAYLVYKGAPLAKLIYSVAAVAWYVALIFFLPERFGQTLDLYALFMQLIITGLALCVLYAR